MDDRRLVGIDLGITSAHTVRVLAGDGSLVCRRTAVPTLDSLGQVERAALAEAAPATRLEVVIEPTGPAWLPSRCSSASVGTPCTGSARALCARPAPGPSAPRQVQRDRCRHPGPPAAGRPGRAAPWSSRRLPGGAGPPRARHRPAHQASAAHKRRSKNLVRQLLPRSPLVGELGQADLAVLERYADPRPGGRGAWATAPGDRQGRQRAPGVGTGHPVAGRRPRRLELSGDHPAVAFHELAAEVHSEVRLLGATQAELAAHTMKREACSRWVDPAALARSLPGLATIAGPALAATMGPASRFATASKFRSFTGLAPRHPRPATATATPSPAPRPATGWGGPPWSARPTTPAGSTPAGPPLPPPDDRARQRPPGGGLGGRRPPGERAWAVFDRAMPYVLCDTDATPVTPTQAKAIIAERWTVPEQVRRRRRSRKGKALTKSSPDMDKARKAQRGDPPLAVQSWTAATARQASPGTNLTPHPP